MSDMSVRLTYVGGPTALIEIGGLRLLTDPTFDPASSEYPTPVYVLKKTQDPAISVEALEPIDVVLLSHDHHFDNLDRLGRAVLNKANIVITTTVGASQLGDRAIGLEPWDIHDLVMPDGRVLRITATPARHGPPGGDRGPVIGFVLAFTDGRGPIVYVSGDSVWFDGIAEVQRRFAPDLVLLFAGAARVLEVGSAHLTFTADEGVALARSFPQALIVPLHFEGWAHFSESRDDLERAFAEAQLGSRLRWPIPGNPVKLWSGEAPSASPD
jgi:L-ascorbate metabolism protein UlaG (beta-lactamase superfamily)